MPSGGARAGSGRKAGGVNEASRLISEGLQRAFVQVGRDEGIEGNDAEVCEQAISAVGQNLIKAGRGDEVLKLLIVNAAKAGTSNVDADGLTPTQKALSKLPGVANLTQRASVKDQTPEESNTFTSKKSDCESDTQEICGGSVGSIQGQLLPALAVNTPPTPPLGNTPHPNMDDSNGFEKKFDIGNTRGGDL